MIEVEIPQSYELIFDEVESTILDGQDISFEVSVEGKYLLLITDIEKQSVISKESFLLPIGIVTRKIYTKSLPKKKLQLTLETSTEVLKSTYIVID